jgi:hypothetical protein
MFLFCFSFYKSLFLGSFDSGLEERRERAVFGFKLMHGLDVDQGQLAQVRILLLGFYFFFLCSRKECCICSQLGSIH